MGVMLIVVSAASFGVMPIFANLAYQSGATPISVLFLRFTGAAIVMIIWGWQRKCPLPRGKTLLILALLGCLGYAGQSFSYFTALTFAPAATVALLLYLYPVLVTGLSVLFFRHRLTKLDLLALVFALTGTVLVIGMEVGGKLPGILLSLAAACIYAAYIIVSTHVTRTMNAFSSAAVIITAASVVYGGLVAWQGLHLPATPRGWGAVAALTLISTVLAIVTFLAGLKRIGPVKSSMLSTLEPVVTVIFAVIFLGESLTLPKIIGGLMVLTTAILLARNEITTTDR